jgi:hypothetical protein
MLKHFFCLSALTLLLPVFANCLADDVSKKPQQADDSRSWATLGRLYVVIATDDNAAGDAGKIAANNGNLITSAFKSRVANSTKPNETALAVVKIPADKLSRKYLLALLSPNGLRPTSQDAVVLYLSAKGGIGENDGQYFEINSGKEKLYRSELRVALEKLNVRQRVLITDTAVKSASAPSPKPEDKPAEDVKKDEDKKEVADNKDDAKKEEVKKGDSADTNPASTAKTSPLYFSLFFKEGGFVDIASALPRLDSSASPDSIGTFTAAFVNLAEANKNKALGWSFFFRYVQKYTELQFAALYPNGLETADGLNQTKQMPVLLSFGKDNITVDERDSEFFKKFYPRGKGVSKNENAAINEQPADTSTVKQLARDAEDAVRPQNDNDAGTHENAAVFDVDNTVLGVDGNPFSTAVEVVAVAPKEGEKADESKPSESKPDESKPAPVQKVRFGVRAQNLPEAIDGVMITEILPESPAARKLLQKGYVILKIDGKETKTEQQYSDAIDAAKGKVTVEYRATGVGEVPRTVEISLMDEDQ